jgi:diphthine synthase
MFYLIGLGLDTESISAEALAALKECNQIYLENYTVDFPYKISELESTLKIKVSELSRGSVEDESIIKESKNKNIALLVYGDSLSATTHMQLILSCKKQKLKYKIFHNSSILTAAAETGLSLYKFGKTTSMPNWKEHTNRPTSFMKYIHENQSINAHSLVLTDIGLNLFDALNQLEESSIKEDVHLPDKIIVFSNAGTKNQKIHYDSTENLKKLKTKLPLCLIIPSELHFLEEEAVKLFSM